MSPLEQVAKLLRADKDFLRKIESRLGEITGRKGIFEKIIEENEALVKDRLLKLKISEKIDALAVYNALIAKIGEDEQKISKALNDPVCSHYEDCKRIISAVKKIIGTRRGFFLKEPRVVEFLLREPPRKVMEYLGYDSVDSMLSHENLFEIWSALRFIEGNEWLNNVFFRQYKILSPDDFEEREVSLIALSERWAERAESFVKKKWHNIGHLKELGVVFVLPVSVGISGEVLRMFSLLFHYLHEVPFYSDMFRRVAEVPSTFASDVISLLRGDVINKRMPESEKSLWFVIQRYLAKEDENDWRLFTPHINPEAMHWINAEEDLVKMGAAVENFDIDLSFWSGMDWVGEYFKDNVNNDILMSFDLVDTVMSLVMQKDLVKYLYHHQEALWNKIFIEYFGRDQLEKFSKNYLLQGYFEI